MSTTDLLAHTRGESQFIDDVPEPAGLLHAAVVPSPHAHASLRGVRAEAALAAPGVAAVLTAGDIPGHNQIGGIIADEVLLADDLLDFVGQPVAVVLAASPGAARRAALLVEIDADPLPAVFDPREAAARGELIAPSRTVARGDVDDVWASCAVVVEGRFSSGSQEHLYLETQAALAVPEEGGRLRLLSSTQAPTAVQRTVAQVLGLPMNAVEVEVRRLGGAFGGKEDQATAWAALAALGAWRVHRPVKLVLRRTEDMRCTGKRHPYSSDYRLGVDRDGRILAWQATMYQNAGAAADLSTAILERSLLHAHGSYAIPNLRVTALSCRTNLPPFTAFRGFGAPQAMLLLEHALARAADALGVPVDEVQERNLLDEGDLLPFGMRVQGCRARRTFAAVKEQVGLESLRAELAAHNRAHTFVKRGMALMPVSFGISFTSTFLNQAGALVHVYTDGSVRVSTGAVEMGQGVNAKLRTVAARTLGIRPERIAVEPTSTAKVANTSPTAASSGADLNGGATEIACRAISDRLRAVAAGMLGASPEDLVIVDERVLRQGSDSGMAWPDLVAAAYRQRVDLSAHAHYATPAIYYDRQREQGRPFAYHVWGAAVVEATVDCLRGRARVDRVRVVHDAGRSLAPSIDRGQVEGAVVQGLGWLTSEDVVYEAGRLAADTLTTYKVPDIHDAPVIETCFLEDADNPAAVMKSKAIGEPPFMYAIGVVGAIVAAMRAFRPDLERPAATPLTPERLLATLYPERLARLAAAAAAAAADRSAAQETPHV